jgi:hypothetical protein
VWRELDPGLWVGRTAEKRKEGSMQCNTMRWINRGGRSWTDVGFVWSSGVGGVGGGSGSGNVEEFVLR